MLELVGQGGQGNVCITGIQAVHVQHVHHIAGGPLGLLLCKKVCCVEKAREAIHGVEYKGGFAVLVDVCIAPVAKGILQRIVDAGVNGRRIGLGGFIAQLVAVSGIAPDGAGFPHCGHLGGKAAWAVFMIIGIDGFGVPYLIFLWRGVSGRGRLGEGWVIMMGQGHGQAARITAFQFFDGAAVGCASRAFPEHTGRKAGFLRCGQLLV